MSDEQTESTSAALARVTAERDALLADVRICARVVVKLNAAVRDVAAERDGYRAYIDEIKAELAEAISVRNALAGQLSEGMRGGMWIVARDGGYECDRCGRGIRRGEAYELLPATDSYQHVHCRDED